MGKSKRQQFIDLAKKGGTRQDFIDLAEELDVGSKGTEDDIVVPIEPPAEPKPPGKAKGGRIGLYANINRRKKLGISRPKSQSTISKEAYSNMKKGFPKKAKGGMAKDESMAHEGKESKKMESRETRLEKKGYRETSSGKMVKKANGGIIKGAPKIAMRGWK